jgi:hypothetical protein
VSVGVGSIPAASVAGSCDAATGAGATPDAGRHAVKKLIKSKQANHRNRDIVRLPKRQQAQIRFEQAQGAFMSPSHPLTLSGI